MLAWDMFKIVFIRCKVFQSTTDNKNAKELY